MKLYHIWACAVIMMPGATWALAAIDGGLVGSSCLTKSECDAKYGTNRKCCVTSYQTIYTCPTGWRADSGGTCRRLNTFGIDAKGYTQTSYGTCAATAGGTQDCYEPSLSSNSGFIAICLKDPGVGV